MVFVKEAEDLRFVRFNSAGAALLGVPAEDLIGKNDHDLFPAEQADFFVAKDRDVLAGKKAVDIPEEPIETPTGTRWLHTRKIPMLGEDGEPRYLLGISMDITERKRAEDVLQASHQELEAMVAERTRELRQTEAQLIQAQRMEAVGLLAAGVAHDFNTMLSVILSYSEIAARSLPEGHAARGHIEQIRSAGGRAADLTHQLLAFSRQQVLEPVVVDADEVLADVRPMLERLAGEGVRLRVVADANTPTVHVDPSQLTQVLTNLTINARDAMPAGGELLIRTHERTLASDDVPELEAGHYVMLSVTDTGVGMDRATRERIFEPFFTTKGRHEGTGLGMSTVFGIVRQSHGAVVVASTPGEGTTVDVFLPFAPRDTDAAQAGAEIDAVRPSESERVLLVEDDPQVRELVANVLEDAGYRVVSAGLPSEALSWARESGDPVDLLLTDVVMPELGGRALAEQLRADQPSMRVLYMSGYADDTVLRHGVNRGELAFLSKPLTPDSLLRGVRDVLDESGVRAGRSPR